MFHISRELYRELAPELTSDRDREHVLRACEAAVERLAMRATQDSLILESFRIRSGSRLDTIGASGVIKLADRKSVV